MDAQATGPVTIETPRGDAVIFHSMGGVEGLSQLFAYEVDVLSSRADLDASDWLGQSVTVQLQRSGAGGDARAWNGIVVGFEYVGSGDDEASRYRLTLRPWLWYLTQSADCRIFQNMRIPDIITKVFQDRGFSDFQISLQESYARQEYVVQYRETHFNFVSRLMDREGIYYFFRHADGKHTLVLADSPHAHEAAAGAEPVPFAPPDPHRGETGEYVTSWRADGAVEPSRFAHADYDFTRPRLRLYSLRNAADSASVPPLEVYDYPGGFLSPSAGDAYAQLRLEQRRAAVQTFVGESNARGLTVGSTFELLDHPRDTLNAKYLLTRARYRVFGHEIRSSGSEEQAPFSCTVGAIRADAMFRPPLRARKALAQGPQTATVVGPDGQEIWTDQYGRVKVQFHWDREGQHDENSSCFVRVSQAWAGTNWGAQFIPRIGQEVVVDFLEGDPDRPIVVGAVYNGTHNVPFKLPENQTQSGIRTRSTPNGTQVNGNEIRFEDLNGNEDLFIQAERTQTTVVKDSQTIAVGTNRSLVVTGLDSTRVGLTRSVEVGGAHLVNVGAAMSETVGGAYTRTVGGPNVEQLGSSSNVTVGADLVTQVGGVARFDVRGALRMNAAGDSSHTTGGTAELRVGGKASNSYAAPTKAVVGHPDQEATLNLMVYGPVLASCTKEIRIETDASIVLKCGDTKISITPDGITLSGKDLKLAADSKLDASSSSAALALGDDVTATGTNVTLSSTGAQLALAADAQLKGSQVKLGSGSGASASSSGDTGEEKDKSKPVYIRTKVLRDGKPAAGVSYKLVLDGGRTLSGTTTSEGLVEQQVPSTVASVTLTLLDTGETYVFAIGGPEPVDTLVGAQQRLRGLGLYHGPLDGTLNRHMAHALEVFQAGQGLSVSGELDAATQSALKSAYGS
jgi:type VI secretion system secreted protein VgrG